jgi:hypothetical protein
MENSEQEVPQEIINKDKPDIKLLNVTRIYQEWQELDVGRNFTAWAKHTLDLALQNLRKEKELVDGQGEIEYKE